MRQWPEGLRRFWQSPDGAAPLEYAIVVSCLALAATAGAASMGRAVRAAVSATALGAVTGTAGAPLPANRTAGAPPPTNRTAGSRTGPRVPAVPGGGSAPESPPAATGGSVADYDAAIARGSTSPVHPPSLVGPSASGPSASRSGH